MRRAFGADINTSISFSHGRSASMGIFGRTVGFGCRCGARSTGSRVAWRSVLGHNGVVKIAQDPAGPVAVDPETTRDRIARLLLEHGPSTATVLADRLKLTPAGIRRHLDALVGHGFVIVTVRPPYGPVGRRGRGRPAKVYSLTDAGRGQFPQDYDTLAAEALRFLAAQFGPEAVQAFARSRMEAVVGQHRSQILSLEPADRPRALAAALTSDGFAASIEPAPIGSGDQLCQHHCPVAHVAAEFPQLCEAETAVLSELLGTHVQRLATIGHGDHVCTTYVPHPSDEGLVS